MYGREEFHSMINSIVPFPNSPSEYIQWVSDVYVNGVYKAKVYLYTRSNQYCIVAYGAEDGRLKGYLGCVVSARKPLAGENHTRGNDLADGPFDMKTMNNIARDIMGYEMVKIVKSARRKNYGVDE